MAEITAQNKWEPLAAQTADREKDRHTRERRVAADCLHQLVFRFSADVAEDERRRNAHKYYSQTADKNSCRLAD